jgi:transcriptional regulator with XRE-family HTH domain
MSSDRVESLGVIIKKAIKDSGFKETFIAEKMNVSRQTINQIDLRKTFDLEFLQKLKAASGLDFTGYFYSSADKVVKYSTENEAAITVKESSEDYRIKMSLTINLSSNKEDVIKMGELITKFRIEALKMGFTID